jgi:hypothetical protein
MATPELNYIVIIFEFNGERMGQVNYHVPTQMNHKVSAQRLPRIEVSDASKKKKEIYMMN